MLLHERLIFYYVRSTPPLSEKMTGYYGLCMPLPWLGTSCKGPTFSKTCVQYTYVISYVVTGVSYVEITFGYLTHKMLQHSRQLLTRRSLPLTQYYVRKI